MLAPSAAWLWLGLLPGSTVPAPFGNLAWGREVALALGLAGPLGLGALAVLHFSAASQADAARLRRQQDWQQSVRSLLDALHTPVALYGAKPPLAWPNRALRELAGSEPAAPPTPDGDSHARFETVDEPSWPEAMAEVRRSGRPRHLKLRLRDDPARREWLAELTPMALPDGGADWMMLELRGASEALAQEAVDRMRALLELAESEKWQFGQAVHDELGQRLSGIAYFAKALQRRLQSSDIAEADDAGWLTGLANESMAVARSLARGLNPVGSDDPEALAASLAELCRSTSKMFEVQCTLEADAGFEVGSSASANHLYHVVQELITNAVRHGHARSIEVRLEAGPEGRRVSVHNDGGALVAEAGRAMHGMGLSGVRSRVAHLDGRFALRDDPAGGVLATIDLPLRPPAAAPARQPVASGGRQPDRTEHNRGGP